MKQIHSQFKTNLLIFLVLLFVFIFPLLIVSAATEGPNLVYDPMETLPGFAKTDDFPTFISNLYKFGIWTVGICALIMIVIGGYMYAASGGNNASMEKAKTFITDALVGLILALLAYLILYIINPELVKIKMGGAAPTVTLPPPANCTGTPWANSILCYNTIPATATAISLMDGACPSTETPCTYRCADGYKAENLKCVSVGAVVSASTKAAAIALAANNKVTLKNSGDCKNDSGAPVSPASSITQATNGNNSTICNTTCIKSKTPCTGNVSMKKELLDAIDTVGKITPLTVESLTGGQHTSATSTHYLGNGADIMTTTKTTTNSEWPSVIKKFQDAGCSAFCDSLGKPVSCPAATHVHVSC